ncbi:hypothetical protein TCCBUS3UF1_8120 [Thermus sp. CCB_US3_UF1]|nr:hypothetical protein TCCBUS3UF1_8120 [Thermus sp. CCB_US3_UF1]
MPQGYQREAQEAAGRTGLGARAGPRSSPEAPGGLRQGGLHPHGGR